MVRWKRSFLVIHRIVRLFVNPLTADDKPYRLNRNNLMEQIQIQFSQNQKFFSQFFLAFLKSVLNFKHKRKKDDRHSWCISGNIGSKTMVRLMSKNPCFRRPLDREHGKSVKTIFQPEWQHFYKIYQYCEGSCIRKSVF